MDEAKNFMLGMMQTLKERIGNPLVGAFAMAWFIWNFKIVLVIFGQGPWEAKIKYIYRDLMPNRIDWAIHGYLIPALAALIWIFLLPPVFRWITVWHERQLNKNRSAIYNVTEEKVLTNEEAISLRKHILDEKTKLITDRENISKSLTDQILEVTNLRKIIDEKDNDNRMQNERIEGLKLTNTQKDVQILTLQHKLEIQTFNLNFDKSNLNNDIINENLFQIGFNVHKKIFNKKTNLVALQDEFSYWPLVTKGQLVFGEVFLLEKGISIDEQTAAVILIIGNYAKKEHNSIIFESEARSELEKAGLKEINASLDYLLHLGLMGNPQRGVFQFTDRFFLLSESLSQAGFKIKYRDFSLPPPNDPPTKSK